MKSTKRFIISNSNLNSHGFRLLTSGADLADFRANPIMYWMHVYPTGEKPNEQMPIGFWEDIQVNADEISGVPNFDDNDELAMKLYHKVEHGTLRACSAGALPVELSDAPEDMVDGQKLPTLKKWVLKECSLVDRGANAGAVALKVKGRMITLSEDMATAITEILHEQNADMKLITLSAAALSGMLVTLKLKDDATEAEVSAKVNELVQLSATQAGELITLKAEKDAAENKYTELVKLANTEKITNLVSKAVADRKITEGQKPKYIKLAEQDFETTQEILASMAGAANLKDALSTADTSELGTLMKLGFDDLFKSDGLERLKKLDVESYKLKYKSKFGKEPNI